MQIIKQSNAPALAQAENIAFSPHLTHRTYTFQEHSLEINLASNYLLYNATAMAHIFGQDLTLFLSIPKTKEVIAAHLACENLYQVLCLNSYLTWCGQPENKLDLILQMKEGQVWVNAFLALRLASFLGSAPLELWVLETRNTIRTEVRKSFQFTGSSATHHQFGVPSPFTHQP